MGIITTKVELEKIRLIDKNGKKPEKKKSGAITRNIAPKTFKTEIDLRGMTGDEAWLAVDKYFDEAIMFGFRKVRLIHGKGTGALKSALWKFLKGDKRISSFRIGQFGEGDGGVTVVELK